MGGCTGLRHPSVLPEAVCQPTGPCGPPPPPVNAVRSVSFRLPKEHFPHRLHSYASSVAVWRRTQRWLFSNRHNQRCG